MKRYQLKELRIVAAWEASPPRAPWRPVFPVFALDGGAERVLWPMSIQEDRVYGHEEPVTSLEAAVAEGRAILVGQPLRPRKDYHLIRRKDGDFAVVHADEVLRSRITEITARLGVALQLLEQRAPTEEIQDAFDGAYLVHPLDPVATTLRAGAAARVRDAEPTWSAQCIDDLDYAIEIGSDLVFVRDRLMWKQLPCGELRETLFRSAREALDDHLRPETDLEPPVAADLQVAAIATALWRRIHGRASRILLPNSQLAAVLTGDPIAMSEARETLERDQAWNDLFKMVDASRRMGGEAALTPLDVDGTATARAKLGDLDRFARTLHHLEQLEEGPARSACWRAFLQRAQGLDRGKDSRPWRQGEFAADELRSRLDLDGHPILAMSALAASNGIFVGVAALSQGEVDAAATQPRNVPPCVFVNERVFNERHLLGRFAMAHELCHLLMDRSRAGGNAWVCKTAAHRADQGLMLDGERRANAFAAYLLAPREAVCALVPDVPALDNADFLQAVLAVRARFGLTATAAAEHLLNCHTGSSAAEPGREKLPGEIRARVEQAAQAEPVQGFEADQDLDAKEQGPAGTRVRRGRFAHLLRRWVRTGEISREHAASLLGVEEVESEEWFAPPGRAGT